jgi:hypothetical protein
MLHEFRDRAGVSALRAINDHMLVMLLKYLRAEQKSVALIDATDLPAATADKKKMAGNGPPSEQPWGRVHLNQVTPGFTLATRSTHYDCG